MKYLFFDLEMAHSKNGGKICEFGYAVTNELFEIIEKDNFIINPDIKKREWDWFAVENILTRSIKDYEGGEKFDKYYPKIKLLIDEADYIFGHSLNNDVKVLNAELKNFNYDSITFDFYDVKNIYKDYKSEKRDVSLEGISKDFDIRLDGNAHDALYDSIKAMLELKYMINHLNFTIEELLELCPSSKYKCENYGYASYFQEKVVPKSAAYNSYVKKVKINKDASSNNLYGKKIYISYVYTKNYTHQAKNLVKLISDFGGEVVLKVSESNVYIEKEVYDCDNNIVPNVSKKILNKELQTGKKIEILKLEDLLIMLNVTIDDINNKQLYFENEKKHNRKSNMSNDKNVFSVAIGELINMETIKGD